MLNLRCTHCGSLNPITSEYQTFCQTCNKKLVNNFADWHRNHPDRTFDDFKAMFGEEDVQPASQKRSSRFTTRDKSGKRKILWGVLVVFILFIGLIIYGGTKVSGFIESFLQRSTPDYYLTQQWDTASYGNYGLVMSSPMTLKEADMDFPQQVLDMTDYLKSFKTAENSPVQALVNVVKYKPQLQTNLQNGANGAVNEIRSKPDISELTYSEEHTDVSGIPAIMQTGKYTYEGKEEINFKDLIILKDHIMWQVVLLYKSGDKNGSAVVERMLQSINIQQ